MSYRWSTLPNRHRGRKRTPGQVPVSLRGEPTTFSCRWRRKRLLLGSRRTSPGVRTVCVCYLPRETALSTERHQRTQCPYCVFFLSTERYLVQVSWSLTARQKACIADENGDKQMQRLNDWVSNSRNAEKCTGIYSTSPASCGEVKDKSAL